MNHKRYFKWCDHHRPKLAKWLDQDIDTETFKSILEYFYMYSEEPFEDEPSQDLIILHMKVLNLKKYVEDCLDGEGGDKAYMRGRLFALNQVLHYIDKEKE